MFFPPIKTPENAPYWPFKSMEAMETAERDIAAIRKRVMERKFDNSFEAFERFMKDCPRRSPWLYRQVVENGAGPPKESILVRQEAPRIEPQRDFKSAAAGEDEEWDGAEDVEPGN